MDITFLWKLLDYVNDEINFYYITLSTCHYKVLLDQMERKYYDQLTEAQKWEAIYEIISWMNWNPEGSYVCWYIAAMIEIKTKLESELYTEQD